MFTPARPSKTREQCQTHTPVLKKKVLFCSCITRTLLVLILNTGSVALVFGRLGRFKAPSKPGDQITPAVFLLLQALVERFLKWVLNISLSITFPTEAVHAPVYIYIHDLRSQAT